MKRVLTPLLAIGVTLAASAQGRPFAAWLLDSGGSVEVWEKAERPSTFKWRLLSRDGAVLAEMEQPGVPPGFVVNYGDCRVSGVLRNDVLAIVKHRDGKEWSGDVRGVWLADPRAGAFMRHSPAGVVCRNEGYGV